MLTLLTMYPLNAHWVWLRLAATEQTNVLAVDISNFVDIHTDTLQVSGIVMRMHSDPWRVDILCYRPEGDGLTSAFKALLEHTLVSVKAKVWQAPVVSKPTILLADDSRGLAALSLLCAWRTFIPSSILLWHTQGLLPFSLGPSKIYTPALPPDMIATMLEFEDLGVVLRVLSDIEKPGCFLGDMEALLKARPDLSTWHLLSQLPS